ncbi:MAG: hypothetical protein ACM31C_05865 [Acidobacteriota bacterium]
MDLDVDVNPHGPPPSANRFDHEIATDRVRRFAELALAGGMPCELHVEGRDEVGLRGHQELAAFEIEIVDERRSRRPGAPPPLRELFELADARLDRVDPRPPLVDRPLEGGARLDEVLLEAKAELPELLSRDALEVERADIACCRRQGRDRVRELVRCRRGDAELVRALESPGGRWVGALAQHEIDPWHVIRHGSEVVGRTVDQAHARAQQRPASAGSDQLDLSLVTATPARRHEPRQIVQIDDTRLTVLEHHRRALFVAAVQQDRQCETFDVGGKDVVADQRVHDRGAAHGRRCEHRDEQPRVLELSREQTDISRDRFCADRTRERGERVERIARGGLLGAVGFQAIHGQATAPGSRDGFHRRRSSTAASAIRSATQRTYTTMSTSSRSRVDSRIGLQNASAVLHFAPPGRLAFAARWLRQRLFCHAADPRDRELGERARDERAVASPGSSECVESFGIEWVGGHELHRAARGVLDELRGTQLGHELAQRLARETQGVL